MTSLQELLPVDECVVALNDTIAIACPDDDSIVVHHLCWTELQSVVVVYEMDDPSEYDVDVVTAVHTLNRRTQRQMPHSEHETLV